MKAISIVLMAMLFNQTYAQCGYEADYIDDMTHDTVRITNFATFQFTYFKDSYYAQVKRVNSDYYIMIEVTSKHKPCNVKENDRLLFTASGGDSIITLYSLDNSVSESLMGSGLYHSKTYYQLSKEMLLYIKTHDIKKLRMYRDDLYEDIELDSQEAVGFRNQIICLFR